MAVPGEFVQILNELNRDVARARPTDTLQFCANWFHRRLEHERKAFRQPSPSDAPLPAPPSAGAQGLAPSDDVPPDSFAASSVFGTPNPFAASPAPSLVLQTTDGARVPWRNSWDSSASTESTEEEPDTPGQLPQLNPALMDLRRRTSVSAESLPVSTSGPAPAIPQIPKTESQMERLKEAVQNHFLFNNLDDEQYRDVLLAMKEVEVPRGQVVIEQGQEGDYFYVVGSGTLEVFKRTGKGPPNDAPATVTVPEERGDKVASYGSSDSFGELALMYAQPRAATVVSTSDCVLWAVDRVTFRTILLESALRRRQLFDTFLKEVPLFEHMRSEERAKLVDSLQLTTYNLGDRPVTQGEKGREFFLIIDGYAEVRKRRTSTATTPTAGYHAPFPEEDEVTVGRLGRGDYFGELALLYNTPRAASVVVTPGPDEESMEDVESEAVPLPPKPQLRVAKLSEKQFTRLLGPLTGIMSRTAKERYGSSAQPQRPLFSAGEPTDLGPDDDPVQPAGSITPGSTAGGTWMAGSPFA